MQGSSLISCLCFWSSFSPQKTKINEASKHGPANKTREKARPHPHSCESKAPTAVCSGGSSGPASCWADLGRASPDMFGGAHRKKPVVLRAGVQQLWLHHPAWVWLCARNVVAGKHQGAQWSKIGRDRYCRCCKCNAAAARNQTRDMKE